MKLTARHYFAFGAQDDLLEGRGIVDVESWDRLRMEDRESHFSIPGTRQDWLRLCEGTSLRDGGTQTAEKARSIVSVVRDLGLNGVCSFGVGGAYLEYNIKKQAPDLLLSCSDYACRSIERLRQVFVECDELKCIDIARSVLPRHPDMLYLLHRVETEFTNREWSRVFARLSEAGAIHVLMVPNNYLTLSKFVSEHLHRIRGSFTGKPARFAGYLRNRAAIEALWQGHYRLVRSLPVGYSEGLLLVGMA